MEQPGGVFVVVPAFNEGSVLGGVLDDLVGTCPWADVVVVDDCSSDDTYRAAAAFPVHLLRHPINLGAGGALATGIMYALDQGAEVIVMFDGDGQMQAADITSVIAPITRGEVDVVLGSRNLGVDPVGIPPLRRLLLRVARLFARATSHLPLTDTHNGFRALTAKAATAIPLAHTRFAWASQMESDIARAGLRWTEVPVTIRYTDYSIGKGQRSTGVIDILGDLFWRNR